MVTLKKWWLYQTPWYDDMVFMVREIVDVSTKGIVLDGLWMDRYNPQLIIEAEELFLKTEDAKEWKEECKWSPSVTSLVA